MDINFCDGCENILYIYTDEENKLYLGCKVCGEKKDYVNNKSIYSNEFHLDFSETINNNKYLSFDNTLPVINNKNIKCPNEDCVSKTDTKGKKDNKDTKDNKENITYIKYNHDDMKYIYICNYCGQKWKNN